MKKLNMARVSKKADRTRKHSLIASIESDEAGEGVFNQGSCAFSDDEAVTVAEDSKRKVRSPDAIDWDYQPNWSQLFWDHKPFFY